MCICVGRGGGGGGERGGQRGRLKNGKKKNSKSVKKRKKKKPRGKKKEKETDAPSGPSPPTRFRTHRCTADPVEPRSGGDTSLTMTAAGARHISESPKPTSSAANEARWSGARTLRARTGAARRVAPLVRR